MEHDEESTVNTNIRVPAILTIRDVFLMITAVISVMVAWGMYGTRLSVVEEKMLSVKNNVKEIRQLIKEVRTEEKRARHDDHAAFSQDINRLEQRLRHVENEYNKLNGIFKRRND